MKGLGGSAGGSCQGWRSGAGGSDQRLRLRPPCCCSRADDAAVGDQSGGGTRAGEAAAGPAGEADAAASTGVGGAAGCVGGDHGTPCGGDHSGAPSPPLSGEGGLRCGPAGRAAQRNKNLRLQNVEYARKREEVEERGRADIE